MNFMGMGMMELAVVFLIAFIVLGPNKSIEMARTAGKVVREVRRTLRDVASAASLEPTEQPGDRRTSRHDDPGESATGKAEDG